MLDQKNVRKYSLTSSDLHGLLYLGDENEAASAMASVLAGDTSSWMMDDEHSTDHLSWGAGCVKSNQSDPCGIGVEIYPYKGSVSIDLLAIVRTVMSAITTMLHVNVEDLLRTNEPEDDDAEEASNA